MMRSIVVMMLLCIGVVFSCGKKSCDISGRYRFRLPVTLSPVQDTFNVGDTILVHSSFLNQVFEVKTSKTYKLEDFVFYPSVTINKLDNSIVDHDGSRFFELYADESVDFGPYVFSDGLHRFLGEYSYSDEEYNLKFILIPKRSGLYLFDITSFLYPQAEDQSFKGKCGNTSSEAYMILNEGDEQLNNHYLLTNSEDTSFIREVLEEGDLKSSFLFYVVE